ncbi:MAG: pseudouridine synthase [Haloplasmataceae bacterium]|jgi:23S rRNA pseudouridine2605 synthase|nr:pseudouridine synthase [Haloplasmataceae bacterium]
MERLQKVIASSGVASRRKSEELIQEGRVSVNGQVVTELGVKVSNKDEIVVDGLRIENEQKVYFVINKPSGCISAVSDDLGRRVVLDYLREKGIRERVFPVGRLDYDTTGVLILTNDGEFSNLLTHPKNEVDKVYLVRCEGIVNSSDLMKLKKGVRLEEYTSAPAKVALLGVDKVNSSSQVRIIIHEGKYHQVKLMFEAIGHPVKKLRREQYAFLNVVGLKPGEFRPLKIHEIKQLYVLAKHKKDDANYHYRRF